MSLLASELASDPTSEFVVGRADARSYGFDRPVGLSPAVFDLVGHDTVRLAGLLGRVQTALSIARTKGDDTASFRVRFQAGDDSHLILVTQEDDGFHIETADRA